MRSDEPEAVDVAQGLHQRKICWGPEDFRNPTCNQITFVSCGIVGPKCVFLNHLSESFLAIQNGHGGECLLYFATCEPDTE